MDAAETLTGSEVIDGVVRAKIDEHAAAVRQVQLTVEWALLHPCATTGPRLGWAPRLRRTAPLAGSAPRWSTNTHRPLGRRAQCDPGRRRLLMADALELVYRLPRLWAFVVAGRARSGAPGRSPGRPATSASTPSPTPTG